MKPSIDILHELNSISPLVANITRTKLYTVPESYFNELPNQVLSHIHKPQTNEINNSFSDSTIENISNIASPYTVPNNYFNQLAGNILNKIANGENAEQAPIFLSENIKTQATYTTPAGYFESFPEKVLASVQEPVQQNTGEKVFSMRKVLQWAAAAIVIGIIAIGSWTYYHSKSTPAPVETASVSSIKNEIKNMSDEDIQSFVDMNTLTYTDINVNDEMNGTDLEYMLQNISDSELNQYLEDYTNRTLPAVH